MPYDHSTKIGNEGDLVKHAVLACVVDKLIPKLSGKFVYAESHTGRAEYVLPESGQWKRGIGVFSGKRAAIKTRKLRNLAVYDEVCIGRTLAVGMKYPGSSGLVFRLLSNRTVPLEFYLWERDPTACNELKHFYHPWPEVNVTCGDGYAGVTGLEKASLVLVDPFDLKQAERNRICRLLKHLQNENTPFVCWTPRTDGKKATVPEDSSNSRQMHELATKGGWSVHRIAWPSGGGATFGCQLTVSSDLTKAVSDTVSELCTLMDTVWIME